MATLAPGEAAQPTDKVITLGIYDPLTTYVDGKVEPYLAESVESNETLDEWTIVLREGVVFHDDTPLNADAVVKHFERLQDPATACPCKTNADQHRVDGDARRSRGPHGGASTSRRPNVAFADFLAGSSGYIESPTAAADGLQLQDRRRRHRPVQVRRVRRR